MKHQRHFTAANRPDDDDDEEKSRHRKHVKQTNPCKKTQVTCSQCIIRKMHRKHAKKSNECKKTKVTFSQSIRKTSEVTWRWTSFPTRHTWNGKKQKTGTAASRFVCLAHDLPQRFSFTLSSLREGREADRGHTENNSWNEDPLSYVHLPPFFFSAVRMYAC